MKNNTIVFVGASVLVLALLIGFAIVRPALAQVAATSTTEAASSTSVAAAAPAATSTADSVAASSTPPTTAPASISATSSAATSPAPAATPPASGNSPAAAAASSATPNKSLTEPPPQGLTLVHINGTKYIDYFTDGSTTIAVPGDPNIDGNLDKPNAPIPTHAGMTWSHTTGDNRYDTPSGDLEVGDYAVQPNGSYIENAPPFVSSTSTPATADSSSTPQTDASTSTDQSTSAP